MKERKFTISFVNIRRSEIDSNWKDAVDRVQSESRARNGLAHALLLYGHIGTDMISVDTESEYYSI